MSRAIAGFGAGVRTLDCWIVFIDEMALNQLDSEAGLSDATAADDHQLILS